MPTETETVSEMRSLLAAAHLETAAWREAAAAHRQVALCGVLISFLGLALLFALSMGWLS